MSQGRTPAGPPPPLDPATQAAIEESAINEQARQADILAEHMSLPKRAILEHTDPCERLLLAARYWAIPGAGALGLKPWNTGGYDPLATFTSVHMTRRINSTPKPSTSSAPPKASPLARTHAELWAHALPEYWSSPEAVRLEGNVAWPSRDVAAWFAARAQSKQISPYRYWDRAHRKVFVFDSTTIEPGRDVGVHPVALPLAITRGGELLPPDARLSLSGLAAMAQLLRLEDDRLTLPGGGAERRTIPGSLVQLATELWRANSDSARPRRIHVGSQARLIGRKSLYFQAESAIPVCTCTWDVSSGNGYAWGGAGKVSAETRMTGITQGGSFVPMDLLTHSEWRTHVNETSVGPGRKPPQDLTRDGIYALRIQPSGLISLREAVMRSLGGTSNAISRDQG